MLGAMDAIGVHRAVIVPPVWVGENNGPALAAAEKHRGRFAVMGRIDPYDPASPDRLEYWLRPSLSVDVVTTVPGDLFTQMRPAFGYERARVNAECWEAEVPGPPTMLTSRLRGRGPSAARGRCRSEASATSGDTAGRAAP